MKKFAYLILGLLFTACVGVDLIDDFVEPSIRITNPIASITEGGSYQFQALYLNNIGVQLQNAPFQWTSSSPQSLSVNSSGVITALSSGEVTLTVRVLNEGIETLSTTTFLVTAAPVVVNPTEDNEPTSTPTDTNSSTTSSMTIETEGMNTETETSSMTTATESTTTSVPTSPPPVVVIPVSMVFEGVIRTTSSYRLSGDFTYQDVNNIPTLMIGEDYVASRALPGLYVYLSNNPNTIADSYEIGAVEIFEGAHQYELPESFGLMDYKYLLYWCKPFNAKVGQGEIFN